MSSLRSLAAWFVRTPLHPQWLLGRRLPPENIAQASGVILDIGAADKWIARHLPSNARYISLDYPATGGQLYGAKPDVFADAAQLPFCDETFNGVVCLEVLEHVSDPAVVMTEIARVLKPRGHVWISMLFLYPLHDAPFDFQRYTEFGLRRDVLRAGLTITTIRKSGHAIRTAGLLMCLAISGAIYTRRGMITTLLLPLALLMVFSINIATFALSVFWPDWKHLSTGHELEASKPALIEDR